MTLPLNGRLADSSLATVPGTGIRVRADLVAQTVALRAAFFHRFKKPLVLTDGYRPYSGDYYAQVETFLRRYTRTFTQGINISPKVFKDWNGVRYYQRAGTAMAAVPGNSNHGWGKAIDFGSDVNVMGSEEHRWMVTNAPRFGWTWPSWWAKAAGEAWHFEAVPVRASSYLTFPGVDIDVPDTQIPIPLEEEFDMLIIQRGTANGSKTLLTPSGWKGPLSPWTEGKVRETFPDIETKILKQDTYDMWLVLLPPLERGVLVADIVAALPEGVEVTKETIEAAFREVLLKGVDGV
jgi:hypothetical protein